jgi:hypothetical protein
VPEKEDDLTAIRSRLEKLETGSRWNFIIQFVVAPLALAYLGFFFSGKLEEAKASLNRVEQEAKRVDALRGMLPELFSSTPERVLIAEQIMNSIADPESKKKIHDAAVSMVKASLDAALLKTGNDKTASNIVSQIRMASEEVQSASAKDVKSYIADKNFFTVVSSPSDTAGAVSECKRLQALGYDARAFTTTNDIFAVVISAATSLNEAQQIGRAAVAKKDVKEFFPGPSKYVLKQVFP